MVVELQGGNPFARTAPSAVVGVESGRRSGLRELVKLPMILTVGGDESPECHRLQHEYQELLSDAGVDVEIVLQNGGHHFDAVDLMGEANGALAIAVLRMIERA